MNIILTGLMGSGKSALGAPAAKTLGMDFLDMDKFIEDRVGLTVSEQFERYGEEYFRQRESEAAAEISSMSNTLVSAGGGIVLRERNMDFLKRTGHVIFIDRPLGHIISDVDIRERPLLKNGPDKLPQIRNERIGLYRKYADSILINDKDERTALTGLIRIIENLKSPKFAVIGDPIAHSLSPAIHLPVLRSYVEAPAYEKVHVKKGGLPAWLDRVRNEDIRGFNLTMPHKVDILPYLDYVDFEAERSSVNTVINRGGKLYGYTTDAAGFFMALNNTGVDHRGLHILILGAGGASGALALCAATDGAEKIGILARRPEIAETLASAVGKSVPGSTLYAGGVERLGDCCESADILINTTPLGMSGVNGDWESLEFLSALPKRAVVCDIIYNPPKTRLLAEAERLGYRCQNGLDMLIYQALLADSLFLGIEIDYKEMAESVKKILNEGNFT